MVLRLLDFLQFVLAGLLIHGAYASSPTIVELPVVALLKERYLWVDSLCIVQDDELTKHAEINNMAYIYSGASITIIAAQGEDANYGLRGLRGVSHPRKRSRHVFKPAKGYEIVLAAPKLRPRPSHSQWSKRGWTFQEQIFSRRRLIFENDSIEWHCSCSTFPEDVEARPGSRKKFAEVDSAFNMSFPSLEEYGRLMRNYNLRDFTHSEDALAAISGTTTALSRHFRGGFLCGLPLMFLDVALCWQPFGDCQRRIPTGNKALTELGLPSWSWMGNSNYQPVSEPQHTMLEWRNHGLQGEADVPPGWKRLDFSSPTSEDEGRRMTGSLEGWIVNGKPRHFYMHENDPYSEFWYPIPMVDESEQQPPLNRDDTLLCCRSQRAWFRLSEKIHDTCYGMSDRLLDMDYTRNSLTQSLRDTQGCWTGALTLNSSDYNTSFNRDKSERTENRSYCQ
ncbi:hypothetical protein EG329_004051 [Mollisiaceae sp. DMI_Dod_QoI]|nr:hypothetical protein EG329_004051 [Helotiales sp. DMI_Dod_QoI]